MELITVEVACAVRGEGAVVRLALPPGTTLREAVRRSRLAERFREIDAERCAVGVFGEARLPEDPIAAGDRIEIYRPLVTDPKEARRQRAAAPRKR